MQQRLNEMIGNQLCYAECLLVAPGRRSSVLLHRRQRPGTLPPPYLPQIIEKKNLSSLVRCSSGGGGGGGGGLGGLGVAS